MWGGGLEATPPRDSPDAPVGPGSPESPGLPVPKATPGVRRRVRREGTRAPAERASCGFLGRAISAAPPTGFLAMVRSAPRPPPRAGPAPGIPAPAPRAFCARGCSQDPPTPQLLDLGLRPAPGPRAPAPPSLPRARVPAPARARVLRLGRPLAPAGLRAGPYFGRWRCGPGQPCPEGRLFWAGQALAAAPRASRQGARAGQRAGRGRAPRLPTFLPGRAQLPPLFGQTQALP